MKIQTIILAGLIFILLLFAISSESLWLDEGNTAYYAIQPSFSKWAGHLFGDKEADCQFPLYMFSVWAWARVAGISEYALRSLNIIFAMTALAVFAFLGKTIKIRRLWLALLIQPFFWFYLNEARPYMLQIAAGTLLLAGFIMLLNGRDGWPPWVSLLAGAVLLYYSTLLSFVTMGAYFLAFSVLIGRKQLVLPSRWFWILSGFVLSLIPGSIYYVVTVLRGAAGSRIWAISPLNIMWVYYELVGATGLGPAVWQMRDIARDAMATGISAQALYPLAWPSLLCILTAGVFASGFLCIKRQPERFRGSVVLVVIFVSTLIAFMFLSVLLKKAFWARHLAPIFPVYALVIYYCLSILWQNPSGGLLWRRVLALVSVVLLVISNGSLLLSFTHRKDDNRLAAKMALDALRAGKTVWWAASGTCGAYYGLPIAEGKSTTPRLHLLQGSTTVSLHQLKKPDIILISRPDIFDGKNVLRDYCIRERFIKTEMQPHVFTVWGQNVCFIEKR